MHNETSVWNGFHPVLAFYPSVTPSLTIISVTYTLGAGELAPANTREFYPQSSYGAPVGPAGPAALHSAPATTRPVPYPLDTTSQPPDDEVPAGPELKPNATGFGVRAEAQLAPVPPILLAA